ncbi:hypothetical protein [Marinicrinis lubricantis]|uniref:DUF4367 domain-containing protein n=1 Tax=Marinicrinis lubricantis TaxID=2086470 RepID=A0ABW1IUW0_9BACL
MKKIWMTLLALTLATAVIGCSSNNNEDSKKNTSSNQENTVTNEENSTENQEPVEEEPVDEEPVIEGNVHSTEDGKAEVTLPDDWNLVEQKQNALSTLEAANMRDEKYIMVISEAKTDIGGELDLATYADLITQQMTAVAQNSEQSDVADMTIDGHPAVQFNLNGTVQGVDIGYLITIIETDRDFHQVVSWSTGSNYGNHEEEFKNIASSFVALDYDESTVPADEDYTLETVDKNGIVMSIPDTWQENEFLSPEADLQYQSKNGYLIVLKEPKADFGDGFELEDYYGLIEANFAGLDMVNNEETTINGNKAIKFDLNGEVEGVKLGYVVAIIEGQDHFYQALTWTMASTFDAQKPLFDEIINSFEESN